MERSAGGLLIWTLLELLWFYPQPKVGRGPQCIKLSSSVGARLLIRRSICLLQRNLWVTVKQASMWCKLHHCKGDNCISPVVRVAVIHSIWFIRKEMAPFSSSQHHLHASAVSTEWDSTGCNECGVAHSRNLARTALLVGDLIKHDLWLTEIFWQKVSISSCAERFC